MKKINYALFLGVILFVIGCTPSPALLDVESFIQTDPAAAYDTLVSIDKNQFTRQQDKALYSLLLSMALDKNYIDICSDSIIAPAVAFYSRHGDRQHRFLVHYYYGRVLENKEDYDGALTNFQRAERCLNASVSKENTARLYARKARIYVRQFAIDRAISEMQRAADISVDISDPAYHLKYCYDLAGLYSISGRKDIANQELEKLSQWMSQKSINPSSSFYSLKLQSAISLVPENKDSLQTLYHLYCDCCEQENRTPDLLLSAKVHNALGQYDEAIDCLDSIQNINNTSFDQADYHATRSTTLQGLGLFQQAMQEEQQYESLVETINLSGLNNDIRFLEERSNAQLAERQSGFFRIVLLSLISLLLAGGLLSFRSFIKYKKAYQQSLVDARAEFDFIKGILKNGQTESAEMEDILIARLNALRPYLSNNTSPKRKPNGADIAKLAEDRKRMLESIGLLCSLTHPRFAAKLAQYNLTPEEIGICSLYVSDYRPKELPDVLGQRSIYQRNTEIRKKLGRCVEDTFLPLWLKKQFAELK